ncbi:BCL-6 corepressor-like protein 1 [Trebouxia sp. C0009 RCD-2024]
MPCKMQGVRQKLQELKEVTSRQQSKVQGARTDHYAIMGPLSADMDSRHKKHYVNLAIVRGFDDIWKLLLSHGANANCRDEDGKPALHHAIFKRNIDVVELLLMLGADVHATYKDANINGRTALHEATIHCREPAKKPSDVNVVKLLLAKGADVSAQDEQASTSRGLPCQRQAIHLQWTLHHQVCRHLGTDMSVDFTWQSRGRSVYVMLQ